MTAALVTRAQAGDLDALDQLYRDHRQQVIDYLMWRGASRAQAEDLAGDVWVKLIRRLPALTVDPRGIGPWLNVVAKNLWIDYVKSGRGRTEWLIDEVPQTGRDTDPSPDEVVAGDETRVEVRALLLRLRQSSPAQAQAIELRYLRGLSIDETAGVLSTTPGAVKALVYRAVRSLRQLPHQHLRGGG